MFGSVVKLCKARFMAPAQSKYENLKNMNPGTAKFATWIERVIEPKIKQIGVSLTASLARLSAARLAAETLQTWLKRIRFVVAL